VSYAVMAFGVTPDATYVSASNTLSYGDGGRAGAGGSGGKSGSNDGTDGVDGDAGEQNW
jgi:hypothetical protein